MRCVFVDYLCVEGFLYGSSSAFAVCHSVGVVSGTCGSAGDAGCRVAFLGFWVLRFWLRTSRGVGGRHVIDNFGAGREEDERTRARVVPIFEHDTHVFGAERVRPGRRYFKYTPLACKPPHVIVRVGSRR